MRPEEVLLKCVCNKLLPHHPRSGDVAVTVISPFVKWRRIIVKERGGRWGAGGKEEPECFQEGDFKKEEI